VTRCDAVFTVGTQLQSSKMAAGLVDTGPGLLSHHYYLWSSDLNWNELITTWNFVLFYIALCQFSAIYSRLSVE
jgi:hypothetical protein